MNVYKVIVIVEASSIDSVLPNMASECYREVLKIEKLG